MDRLIDTLARIGWHGFAGAMLIGTFCGGFFYALVVLPDGAMVKELTGALVVLVGAGGAKAMDQFGRRRDDGS